MAQLSVMQKLEILSDAAKYDATCASSNTTRNSVEGKGIGSTTGSGICHSYAPDGRCISLLKDALIVSTFDWTSLAQHALVSTAARR